MSETKRRYTYYLIIQLLNNDSKTNCYRNTCKINYSIKSRPFIPSNMQIKFWTYWWPIPQTVSQTSSLKPKSSFPWTADYIRRELKYLIYYIELLWRTGAWRKNVCSATCMDNGQMHICERNNTVAVCTLQSLLDSLSYSHLMCHSNCIAT